MYDLSRIANSPALATFDYRPEVGSTNDVALQHAGDDNVRLPLLVLTSKQTGGRGRGSNHWWAAEGSLTCSLLLEPRDFGLATSQWPVLSLVTGLAICEALEALAPGRDFAVKWPNDVYLAGRKICGILLESPAQARGRLIAGIGVNVNNSFSAAPPELAATATSLMDHLAVPLEMTDALLTMLNQLQKRWTDLATGGFGELLPNYRSRCLLDGTTLTISSGNRESTGRCLGIDDEGALIVQTESTRERFLAGTILRFSAPQAI